MNEQEFIKEAYMRGYSYQNTTKDWLKHNRKEEYTEGDLTDLARYANRLDYIDESRFYNANFFTTPNE